jgi:hypothetical protein
MSPSAWLAARGILPSLLPAREINRVGPALAATRGQGPFAIYWVALLFKLQPLHVTVLVFCVRSLPLAEFGYSVGHRHIIIANPRIPAPPTKS